MKITGPFSQVIPMQGLPLKGPLNDSELTIILNGGILSSEGGIIEVGGFKALKDSFPGADIDEVSPGMVCLPGFIDAHTHCCWAGSRAPEYAMRLVGKSYKEIAKEGGGIWGTVTHTRQATEKQLVDITAKRLGALLHKGTTTVEIKSGYGLNVDGELKMLRVLQKLDGDGIIDIIPTCLAAHIPPIDFNGLPGIYLQYIIEELFPQIEKENLTKRIDIFIDDIAFNATDADYYLSYARNMDYDVCLHGNQFSNGSIELALKHEAVSIDHLEVMTDKEIHLLATGNTVGVVLPGASLGTGQAFAPCRKMIDAGCCIAIASDFNPGSAPMGDLLTQASLLAIYEKLSTAEVFAGITSRAAKALKLTDRGQLTKGCIADFIAFPCKDFRDILYYQGSMKPVAVWKNGKKT